MAVKRIITKAVYDALSDALKAEYKASGDEYLLDITGDQVPTLTKENETLKARADKADTDLIEVNKNLKTAKDEYAAYKASSNHTSIADLEKSYKEKEATTLQAHTATVSKLSNSLKKSYVDSVAESIAKEISTVPVAILPHIKARLAVDLEGDEPRTQVLDKDGKLSANNLDDLKAEFIANKDFSAIMIGSKAKGGAPSASRQHPNFGGGQQQQAAVLANMSPRELGAHLKAAKESNANQGI